jgi:hypothetical protein
MILTEPVRTAGITRVRSDGTQLRCGGAAVRIRGVTYGSLRPWRARAGFPQRAVVAAELAALGRLGVNAIRTYEIPPPDLLEVAGEHGIRVLVGLPFHDWRNEPVPGREARRRIASAGHREVDRALEVVAGRHEVLGVAVGREVPVDLVRLHHRHHVEQMLSGLVDRLHDGDGELLATCVNAPATEFLEVPNQDLVTFNVMVHDDGAYERYVHRLTLISRNRPLLVSATATGHLGRPAVDRAALLRAELRSGDRHRLAGAFVCSPPDGWVATDRVSQGRDLPDPRVDPDAPLIGDEPEATAAGRMPVRVA